MEEAKKRMDSCKKQLIELANNKKSRIGGLLVQEVEKKGTVSYSNAFKALLPDADLTPFTGKPAKYWMVK